jgi:hypothetical protein
MTSPIRVKKLGFGAEESIKRLKLKNFISQYHPSVDSSPSSKRERRRFLHNLDAYRDRFIPSFKNFLELIVLKVFD